MNATLEKMQTLGDIERTPGACFVYYGDRADWPIAYAVHRDSELIERSNFESMRAAFDEVNSSDWAIETTSHWAVGHVDYLLVRPDTGVVAMADEMRARINDYPILDENLYSEMESDEHEREVCEQWCSMCEYEKEDHARGDRHDDCRLCRDEKEKAHYADECGDDCTMCADEISAS